MEEAQRQYLEKGITITYEYMAPEGASAEDQAQRLLYAEEGGYDVIGVDVADADLTEALCEKLNYKGKVAILVGSIGAPCHEDRARGAENTIAKYPDMEIVATEYDMDSVDLAYELTLKILADNPDLDGIIYCLGVQDCYSIGYDTIQIAVKIADGNLPGELFDEKTDEITTVIYQEDAALMLELLYGDD